MRMRKLVIGILVALTAVGCAATAPTARPQTAPGSLAAAPTATRVRVQRPTPTPAATEAASVAPTVQPTVEPSTPTPQPTATTAPSSASVAAANPGANPPAASLTTGSASGVLLRLSPTKYPAPTLLTPDDNAVYHISQPIVQLTWSGSDSSFMTFGQTPGCVSDATNFRRAFESYQLVIHNMDDARPDMVQWNENNPQFYLNLTTVPAGRYSWKVNIVTLCESYVMGQRATTIQRSLVAPASPTSATRIINWVP